MSINNQIYYILKLIDDTDDFSKIDIEELFEIKKVKLSKNQFLNLLDNLIKDGFIEGLILVRGTSDEFLFNINNPHLTYKGKRFLEENSIFNKLYRITKEVKSVIK